MTELRSFLLTNQNGDEVCITNYGARIVQWHTLVEQQERNIVLGYSSLANYLEDPAYLGAIAGPFANRIAKSCFVLPEQQTVIQLAANEGIHHLHGGPDALSNVVWHLEAQDEQTIEFSYLFADGRNGYPGDIQFRVRYQLTDNSELKISLAATSEQATVIGPTSHAYFNLAGVEQSSNEHLLHINANYYTEVDEKKLPTGNIVAVEETRLDFTKPRILKHDDERDQIDHNFILNSKDDWQAILISPDKKLQLHVSTTYPGLQVYTGDYLSGKFSPRQGFCLEPQYFPDSPNQSEFPFQFTTPEQPFEQEIVYQLVKLENISSEPNDLK
ncbi:aldose 1-epimerase [Thalassotalea insulae]|uniref:Aldose 1-epimerase n=1 Tax=Thalassotalea insulae TaxID=2056778 RepID=A0ABQ6GN94_9GAMM|nr:aldose epimerase family protein [Thalassotalea insulae]GLX77473.1 aldose 1-epimerase [Thalassotalea insulae]